RFGDFGRCARRSCSHCCNRRWRFDYGTGERGESAQTQGESLGSGTGNGGPRGIIVRETIAAGLHRVEAIVCGWGGGQKYFTADVGPDAAGGGWFNCR